MKAILPLAIASALVLSACGAPEAPAAVEPAPAAMETPADPMPAEPMPEPASNPTVGGASMDATKDIVTNASAAPNLSTLVAAVKAADLVATLQGAGPFTVFAPTDAAFAKVPKADLDALLKDKAKLTAVLTYHVVPGKVMAKDVKAGKVKTVQGSDITVTTMGGVMVDNAHVTATDIAADNGVIHVIDTVIMPK